MAVNCLDTVFHVNPQLDIPIYQQLVDEIRAGVKKGTFVPGQQLPTVQQQARDLGLSAGTVKRAPKWMIRMQLEWLYRLIKEPWRLGRMMRLPKFVLAVLGHRIRGGKKHG